MPRNDMFGLPKQYGKAPYSVNAMLGMEGAPNVEEQRLDAQVNAEKLRKQQRAEQLWAQHGGKAKPPLPPEQMQKNQQVVDTRNKERYEKYKRGEGPKNVPEGIPQQHPANIGQHTQSSDGIIGNKPDESFWKGNSEYVTNASLLSPAQRRSQEELLSSTTNQLKTPPSFAAREAQAMQNYKENILPATLERFTQTGAAATSPGLASRLRGNAQALQTNLHGQREEFEERERQGLRNQFGTLMGRSIEPIYHPAEPGYAQNAAPGLINFAQKTAGNLVNSFVKAYTTQDSNLQKNIKSQLNNLSAPEKAIFINKLNTANINPEVKNELEKALRNDNSFVNSLIQAFSDNAGPVLQGLAEAGFGAAVAWTLKWAVGGG